MRSFSSHLKQLRKGKGMSQEDLARKLNVTRQTVSGWETERCQPDIETLMALADALDADIQELIYGTKPGQYLRYRRKYVVWSAVCGGISALFVLFWVFFLPTLRAYFANNFMGHALYFTYWGLPQLGWFAFGVFLPAALQMFYPIRLQRKLRNICAALAVMTGFLGLLMFMDTLLVLCTQNTLGLLFPAVIYPVARVITIYICPVLSGVLLWLGLDRT